MKFRLSLTLAMPMLWLFAHADPARATPQDEGEAASDSVSSMLSRIGARSVALADSAAADSTAADSLAVDLPFQWFAHPRLTLSADIRADVSLVSSSGAIKAQADLLDGYTTTTGYNVNHASFRQQDRVSDRDNLDATFNGSNAITGVSLAFTRAGVKDVTTLVTTGRDVVIENDQSRANLVLDGQHLLPGGVQWVLSGQVENFQQNNRGTIEDRRLADGGLSTRWNRFLHPDLEVRARFGLNRATGERVLGTLTDDAKTSQDTAGASVSLTRGRRITMHLDLDRIWFDERRLDFFKSASGAIDTVGRDEDEKIGRENETQTLDRFAVRANARVLPVLAMGTTFDHEFSETSFTFSQQGIIQRRSDRWTMDSDFRYAQAGSLQAAVSWNENWNDRRTRVDTNFRGREIRRTKEASLKFFQQIFRTTDVDVTVSQRLSQSIYEEEANKNDRDQLVEKAEAQLRSKAIPKVAMNLRGTISRTDEIRIASERVGNNKEDRLFEVSGGYSYRASPRLTIDQSTKMQIVFNDFHNSDDRDKFNKQGQLTAGATYTLSPQSSFSLDYRADFRSSGTRFDDGRRLVSYRTTLRSLDHQLRATLSFPLPYVTVSLDSSRGFLRRENPSAGTEEPEDRGEFRAKVAGGRTFLGDRLEFRVDFTRVLAFGPRVRPENEDYWIANSGLSMEF